MDQARERAVAAQELLAAGHLEPAVSVAYYAMLNAARAALSEDDTYARTAAEPGIGFTRATSPQKPSTRSSTASPPTPSTPASGETTRPSPRTPKKQRRSSRARQPSPLQSSGCWRVEPQQRTDLDPALTAINPSWIDHVTRLTAV